MGVYDLALMRRTIRKFQQKRIDRDLLVKLINAARYSPSFANLQPVKYVIVNEDATVQQLFKYVKWAGYISPLGNPAEGERPVAFLVLLADTQISKQNYEQDIGAAAQTIFLTALEEGIGTCWMGAITGRGSESC
jgi:nitroreductase